MSKKIKIISLITISFFIMLMIIFSLSSYSILTLEDFLYWRNGKQTQAISIPETGEKYYNEWKCFKLKNVKVSEVTLDYSSSPRILPILEVKDGKSIFEFDIDPTYNWNKDAVINKWTSLINNQEKICIFSAYLQKDPDLTSVWMISKIKTKNGYWNISEHSQYSIEKE